MESLNNNIVIQLGDITDLETIIANNIKMALETKNNKLEYTKIHNGVEELLNNPNLGWYYQAEIDGHNA